MLVELERQQAEIEQLRAQLVDSISRETVIATELERDEAREAARFCWTRLCCDYRLVGDPHSLVERWPWLEEEASDE